MQRKDFVLSASAAALATAALSPLRALASPYQINGEDTYTDLGILRSVTFPRTSDRFPSTFVFASLARDSTKGAIASGTQIQRGLLQLRQLADDNNATVAINGGFFLMPSFAFDGLLVIEGKQLSSANAEHSGAVTMDAKRFVSLTPIADVGNPEYALQTGPFFIDPGGTMGMRSHTYDRFERSFIATSADKLVVGVCSPLSLYDLAEVMLQYPDAFGVSRFDAGLNLCGAATSGFYARSTKMILADDAARLSSPAVLLFGPA
jgi:hypothetical protein